MSEIPFFSVILPTFNRDNIDVSIQSVLKQTFTNYELIVVDDHSEIPAIERCEILKDKRVCYYYLERNGGAAVARNYGIVKSRGKYITFLDDDDVWFDKKLDVLYHAIQGKEPDLVYHDVVVNMVNEHLCYETHKRQEKHYWPLLIYANAIGGTPVVAIKKATIEKVGGFDEDLRSDEDGELFMRIARNGGKMLYADHVLGIFNVQTNVTSLTKSLDKRMESRLKIDAKYKEDIETLLNPKQRRLMREGHQAAFAYASMLNYNKKGAFSYYLRAFFIRGNMRYLLMAGICLISIRIMFCLRSKM